MVPVLSVLSLILIWLLPLWVPGLTTLATRRDVLFLPGIPVPILRASGALLSGRYQSVVGGMGRGPVSSGWSCDAPDDRHRAARVRLA